MKFSAAERVCVSLSANDVSSLSRKVKRAAEVGARLVELRLDALDGGDYTAVVREAQEEGLKTVATVRRADEGGKFRGDEEGRLKIVKEVAGVSYYVDIELRTLRERSELLDELKASGAKLIVSLHYFDSIPTFRKLKEVADEVARYADIVKVVGLARDAKEVADLLSLYSLEWSNGRLIAFSMGEEWKVSRLVSVVFGAPFTYTSLDEGTAPGQLHFEEAVKALEALRWAEKRCRSSQ